MTYTSGIVREAYSRYTEAGVHEPAVTYWYQAGHRASEHSAYLEAIAHLRKGLEVLHRCPQTGAHAKQELTLQLTLGPALTATQGYASPEVERAYTRARDLGQHVGAIPEQFLSSKHTHGATSPSQPNKALRSG